MNDAWQERPTNDGLWWGVCDDDRNRFHLYHVTGTEGRPTYAWVATHAWQDESLRPTDTVRLRPNNDPTARTTRWQRASPPSYRWPLLPEEDYSH